MVKAIILAGGEGTRLRPLTYKTPKALITVGEKTLTELVLDILKENGVRDMVLSVGYMADKVKSYFKDGRNFGVRIEYAVEEKPMGTAGPLILMKKGELGNIKDAFFMLNGDDLFDINLQEMLEFHKKNKAIATIALTKVDDHSHFGVVRMKGDRILEFVEKPKREEAPSNLINSGYYVMDASILDYLPDKDFVMLERDVFPRLAKEGRLFGYVGEGQWFDTGTFERYEEVKREWRKRIKVLAIAPTFYPMMGGAERVFYELYSRLAKLGFDIDLVTPNLGGKPYEFLDGFNVIRVGKPTKGRAKKFILYQLYAYNKIKKMIARKKYDLIHVSYGLPNCFLVHWLKKKLKVPLVVTEHHYGTGGVSGPKDNPFFVNKMLKWAYNDATKVVTTGLSQKQFVVDVTGRKDVKVISNGVDEHLFRPENHDVALKKKYGKGELIITVARLDKRKNLGDFIKAAKLVAERHPAAKFLIIGKGEEKENLEKLIRALGVEKNVIMTGFVSDQDLLKYYATADIFVLTSRYEGFGIVYCEAMASGTPVVCYDMVASREVVANGLVGLITPQNPQALAEALIKLIKDEALMKRFRNNCRKYVLQRFTWQKTAEDYADEFKKLVKKENE